MLTTVQIAVLHRGKVTYLAVTCTTEICAEAHHERLKLLLGSASILGTMIIVVGQGEEPGCASIVLRFHCES